MKLYFTPESALPSGVGFSMFGTEHLTVLLLIALLACLFFLRMRRRSEAFQIRVLRIMALSMPILEIIKDGILMAIGAFSKGYLPLHLCSIAMLVCIYYAFHAKSNLCGQILYSVCLPGALCALLFPDWTMFPLFHFQSVHSFLYHGLLTVFSLYPLVTKRTRPSIQYVPQELLFLILCAIPVGILNRLLNTNYMFLNHASKGSPLELLTALPGGQVGYLLGYGILALLVLLLMNLPFTIAAKLKK